MKNSLKIMQDYKITLIDFSDSFSYNILSSLHELELKCELIHYSKISNNFIIKEKNIVILGPGPGHPSDYSNVIGPWLKNWFNDNRFFIVGICLGHQLILSEFNFGIKRRISPRHGQSRKITIPNWPEFFDKEFQGKILSVQEYNSLFVSPNIGHNIEIEYYSIEEEIVMAKNEKFISFQFHPESIGTQNSALYFDFIKRWLKNGK